MSHSMPSHLIPSPAPRQRSTSQHRAAEHTRTRNTEESTCGSACSQTRTSVSLPPFLVCSSPRHADMTTFGKTPVSQVGWALLLRSGLCTSACVARVTNAWFGRPCSFLRSRPATGEGLGSTRTIYTWMRMVLGLVVWWLMVVMVCLVVWLRTKVQGRRPENRTCFRTGAPATRGSVVGSSISRKRGR